MSGWQVITKIEQLSVLDFFVFKVILLLVLLKSFLNSSCWSAVPDYIVVRIFVGDNLRLIDPDYSDFE